MTHGGITAKVSGGGNEALYAVGGLPKWRVKLEVNDPTLVSPTRMQMSATE
jgi:hypothetical protein